MSKKSNKTKENQELDFDFDSIGDQILAATRKSPGVLKDGQGFVNQLVGKVYEKLLEQEMEEHLGYAKNDISGYNTGNSRNGHGKKTLKSKNGEFEIKTPRDRNSTFSPKLIEKGSGSVTADFTNKVISLYARGMTTREISEHIEEIYKFEVSESFVSRAVLSVQEEVNEWQNRPLEELYSILYIDGIRFNVRTDNEKIVKKCFYTVLGVNLEGEQEVLGLWIADTESASFWLSVLTELQTRGVKDILIACVDGLTGMPEAIESVFPKTDIQLCIVHQIRNCTKFVSYKDRKAICADMKKIYSASSEKAAKVAFEELKKKWGEQYPAVIMSWENKWELLIGFLRYPQELRKITYTTNSIEALHALLRKNTKNRRVFPNDDSLFRLLFLNIRNLSKKWTRRTNWGKVLNQICILFKDRVSSYIDKK